MTKLISLRSNTLSKYYEDQYINPVVKRDVFRNYSNSGVVSIDRVNENNILSENKNSARTVFCKEKLFGNLNNLFSKKNVAIILSTLLAIIIVMILSTTAFGSTPQEFETVVVTDGDSLWSIAQEFNYGNQDIRRLVADIIEVNSLDGDYIYPDMILKVPVRY